MTELVSYTQREKVATITLQNGKVNAISPDVIREFNSALNQAEKDEAVVVITGQPGMFSGGFDLKIMGQSMEAALALVKEGSTLTRRLLSFPTPVVIGCTGHAIAKGAFLLLSADLRIGAEGPYKIGLNEVAIGLTMHHAGIEMARARLNTPFFNRSVINAEMFDPKGALEAGFLDILVPGEQVLERALAEAQKLSQLNMKAHLQTKLKARDAYLKTLDEAIKKDANANF